MPLLWTAIKTDLKSASSANLNEFLSEDTGGKKDMWFYPIDRVKKQNRTISDSREGGKCH